MQPKPVEQQTHAEATKERDYASRVSGAISGSIVSIGDVFKDYRDGTKAVRFPKDLLKVLEQKLQDIAMGKDSAYAFRSYIASLYQLNSKDQVFRPVDPADDGRFLWAGQGREFPQANEGEQED